MVFTLATPTLETEREFVHRRTRKWTLLIVGIVIGVVVIFLAWSSFLRSNTGDPGGRVLSQLTPVLSAVPSDAHRDYVWRMEPRQDSCDGMAGTQGWGQVVVQSGFNWPGSGQALAVEMDGRLTELGWTLSKTGLSYGQPAWSKTLSNGKTADLSVSSEGSFTGPSSWELVATAPPVGKAAGGW